MLAMTVSVSYAQSTKEFSEPLPPSETAQPLRRRSLFSGHGQKDFKVRKQKVTHTAKYEFYQRVEQAAKEHQRALRKLSRPQFSDFLYYGHKRKPKKHSADKMRYCPECGIRH
jgi:hypothetical protein